jgi:PleD family two-component response regulator
VQSLDYRYGEVKIDVSCSFGVAELTGDMANPQDLYRAADGALFQSKRDGRSRVSVHSSRQDN